MKTCLLTTPLVLFALGVKTISALPATSDAAVLAAGVGPAAIAEKMVTSSSTPAALEMEKRTFNPLRGCWHHHCKNPPFPFPSPPFPVLPSPGPPRSPLFPPKKIQKKGTNR